LLAGWHRLAQPAQAECGRLALGKALLAVSEVNQQILRRGQTWCSAVPLVGIFKTEGITLLEKTFYFFFSLNAIRAYY